MRENVNAAAEKRAARVRMFIYFAAGMAGLLFGLDQGEILNEIPASLKVLAEVEPVYETFEGWKTDISGIRTYEELPEKARIYLERMAEVTGIDLGIVSVGPNRDQTIVLAKDLF